MLDNRAVLKKYNNEDWCFAIRIVFNIGVFEEDMNDIVRFEPRQTKRAFEHISEQIRNLVYTGAIKPGERLPSERELAEQFQTGRLAVREAFRVLEQMGLVYIRKGKTGGAYIGEFNKTVFSKSLIETIESDMPSYGRPYGSESLY